MASKFTERASSVSVIESLGRLNTHLSVQPPVSVSAIEIPKHWALCVLGAASRLYIRLSVSLLQPRLEMASTWCRQFRLSVSRYTKHSFFSLCFPRTVWRNSNRIVPLSWGQSREIIQRGFLKPPLFVWSYKFL